MTLMSFVVHGVNRITLMMEEYTHFLISPPVALCHNTSSLPLSLSSSKSLLYPLRCLPPPLLYSPLFLEAFASQWWGGPETPLFGTDRWEPRLHSRWPRLSAASPGHWPFEAAWNAGWLSGDNVEERPPSDFDGHNPASTCIGWTSLPCALALSDWSVRFEDRRSLFRWSVMGGALR